MFVLYYFDYFCLVVFWVLAVAVGCFVGLMNWLLFGFDVGRILCEFADFGIFLFYCGFGISF